MSGSSSSAAPPDSRAAPWRVTYSEKTFRCAPSPAIPTRKRRALTDAGAEVVEGSFDDRASLDRALDGAYGAFSFEEQSGEEMTVMYRWFEDVGYDADIEALREAHPGLQRLEPFLREHGWDTTIA